jgi:rhodanese-related sulfurtransferase
MARTVRPEVGDLTGVDRVLWEARTRIGPRIAADDLSTALAGGALVIDIRPSEQRRRDGELEGAVVVDRNVLEWRLDPTSPHRLPVMNDPDRQVIIVCNEGYASSLAAATLTEVGLTNVTDLDGGFQAWLSGRPQR